MAVEVIEVKRSAYSSGATHSVTLATVPEPGDVIVLLAGTHATREPVGAAGMGATWTLQASYANTTIYGSAYAFTGTGATSAGTVTVTLNGSTSATITALLVRGLTSDAVVHDQTTGTSASQSNPVAGPLHVAGVGQFVVDLASIYSATPDLQAITPALGWTIGPATGRFQDAYRIATDAEHQVGMYRLGSGSATGATVMQLIVGEAGAPASPGSATLNVTTEATGALTVHHQGVADLGVTTVTTGSITVHHDGAATLAVTTSVAGEITVRTAGQAAATLAITTTVTGAITVPATQHAAAATLGISVAVSGAITTDGELPAVALDNLSFTVHRAPPFHRVKVQGKRGSISYSYAPAPRLVACTAPDEVRLTVGDPTAELWLEAPDGQWWLGDLHQPHAPQLAANTTAFARTEGSWAGGRVETDEGDLIRWATAADFTIATELVGPAAVKVTLGPGAGLTAGEFYVNKPPTDLGLPVEVERRALPVFTAWSVSRSTIDVVGYSAPIGASTRPDYVHDAGFACGFDTGPRTPEALASDIATRAQQPGELMLDCPPDDVQVGQRWTTRVDATAGLTGDVVILGRPDLTWAPNQQSMTLRVWAMSITPT